MRYGSKLDLGFLGRRTHLVGKTPKEHRNHHTTPELGHDVEEHESPIANDSNRPKEPRPQFLQGKVGKSRGMQHINQRVHEEGKSAEKRNEREDARVKELLFGKSVSQLGVDDHEPDGHGQVNPRLKKRDDLRTTSFRRHHQHVLGVSKNSVVEQDAKEHQPQRHHFLKRHRVNSQNLLLWGFGW